ncbi:MAG: hypothetical protein ACREH4_07835 [Vitreimonas sp.]
MRSRHVQSSRAHYDKELFAAQPQNAIAAGEKLRVLSASLASPLLWAPRNRAARDDFAGDKPRVSAYGDGRADLMLSLRARYKFS